MRPPPTSDDEAPGDSPGGLSRPLVYDFAGERTPEQVHAELDARWAKPTPRLSRHRRMLAVYQDARDAWEAARDAVTLGYATENGDYQREHPSPTLGQFMREFR